LDLYGAVVFVHAATILLFFIAHGTSMAVAFALKRETDPARVRTLLDLSRFSLGPASIGFVVVGLLTGIAAGFMGGHWGSIWIWLSLVLFVLIGGLMTPMASMRLKPIRVAAGMPVEGSGAPEAPPREDPAELARLLQAWNPLPLAAMGLTGFIVILWLMLAKPF
jgi:uncharacterized membrane protein